MTKKIIDKKDYYIESYKQYITLIAGAEALNIIDAHIEKELNKRKIETPEKNNKAILETAILNNV